MQTKSPRRNIHRGALSIAIMATYELVARATISSATATAAIFAGFGLVNIQRASAQLVAAELLNRRRAFFFGRHFDEAKAA